MVRLLLQAVAALALFASSAADEGLCIIEEDTFGATAGNTFSDLKLVTADTIVKGVSVASTARIDSITLNVQRPSGMKVDLSHGGTGGISETCSLEEDEYINRVEIVWHDHKNRGVRIFYIKFVTNKARVFEHGKATGQSSRIFDAPSGYHLIGLKGFAGDEIEGLGVIWGRSSCNVIAPAPAPAPAPARE